MKKILIFCVIVIIALGVNAQTRKTTTKSSAKTTVVATCHYCHGKGYLLCPRCKGKLEVNYTQKEIKELEAMGIYGTPPFLCDMCCVDEKGISSASTQGMREMEANNYDAGKVKCPYCNTKSSKKHKKVSKEAYEALTKQTGSSALSPTQAVQSAVKAIYASVSKEMDYNNVINKYGSSNFKNALVSYNKNVDGVGDIDYDLFIQGQEFYKFSYEVKSVTMKGTNSAEAKVAVKNSGKISNVTLIMVKENNKWVLDDFIDNILGSAKKVMKANQ